MLGGSAAARLESKEDHFSFTTSSGFHVWS